MMGKRMMQQLRRVTRIPGGSRDSSNGLGVRGFASEVHGHIFIMWQPLYKYVHFLSLHALYLQLTIHFAIGSYLYEIIFIFFLLVVLAWLVAALRQKSRKERKDVIVS